MRDTSLIKFLPALLLAFTLTACASTEEESTTEPTTEEAGAEEETSPESDPIEEMTNADAVEETIADVSEEESGDVETYPPEGPTINFTGIARYWVSDTPGVGCTVCLHGTNNCATVSETGIFNLQIPANAEIILTYTGGNAQPTAFSFVSDDEDMVGQTLFVLPERPAVDFMLNLAGVAGGFDITKSIMTMHAGPETFPSGRGMPGLSITIDGPTTDAKAFYMVTGASSTGVEVAGDDVTATTSVGHAFYANIEPGDYLVTFNDSEDQNRICSPRWGWPVTDGGLPENTYRVKMLEGFTAYASVRCETTDTITATGALTDFVTGEGIEGAKICVSWQTLESGPFDNESCSTTDTTGAVVHDDLLGDHQYLVEITKEGYMKTVLTLEAYTDDITWDGFLSSFTPIEELAATADITTKPTEGHLIVKVVNEDQTPLNGYTVTLLNESIPAKYSKEWAIDTSAASTSLDGIAVFFNAVPDKYDLTVQRKDETEVICSVSSGAWGTDLGYAAPVEASTVTQVTVVCVDEPAP